MNKSKLTKKELEAKVSELESKIEKLELESKHVGATLRAQFKIIDFVVDASEIDEDDINSVRNIIEESELRKAGLR